MWSNILKGLDFRCILLLDFLQSALPFLLWRVDVGMIFRYLFLILVLHILKWFSQLLQYHDHLLCLFRLFISGVWISLMRSFWFLVLNLFDFPSECLDLLGKHIDFTLHLLCIFLIITLIILLDGLSELIIDFDELIDGGFQHLIFFLEFHVPLLELFKLSFSGKIVLESIGHELCCWNLNLAY